MKARINIDSFKSSVGESQTKFFDKEAKETSHGKKSGLPKLGNVKIGEMKNLENGKSFPSSLDHFKIDTVHNVLAMKANERYGNQPKTLDILFHTNEIENHCIEQLRLRDSSGKLVAYGDGENFMFWNENKKDYVSVSTDKKPNFASEALEYTRSKANQDKRHLIDWEHILTLRFCIRDLGALGFWQFETKAAKTTIGNIRDMIDQCTQLWGTFQFFPFILSVKMAESNNPGMKRKYPVVDLVPAISMEQGLRLADHIKNNDSFRPANIALMDFKQENAVTLLTSGGEPIKLLAQ